MSVTLSRSVKSSAERFILDFDLTPYLEGNCGRIEEDGDITMRELKRYFVLVLHGHKHSMRSKSVDTLWHNFILNTKGYREFCQDAFGKFVDHIPRKFWSKSDCTPPVDKFISDYQTLFQEVPPTLWELSARNAGDCAGCNGDGDGGGDGGGACNC